ncbi:DUF4390 domain-containing protein [Desulfovibrio sp. UCD-KL4C]|uniref:DUF4390 domain-containing protein n=1 Tax=Desulfovibrio sp. UCD-KL4C TaxID=2578120 RepID=UPI0025C0EBE5|nr:DUF4390 domain-containing protein [Desulfovibrio sp. UCD-KL4C]
MTAKNLTARNTFPALTLSINLLVILCTIFIISLFSPSCANAASLNLKNLVLDNQAGAIMARFGLELKDDTKTEAALENGIKLKLECKAALYLRRSMWPDSKIASKVYTDKLYYSSLSKEFILEKFGNSIALRDKKITMLLQNGWNSIVMDLGPWSSLKRGEQYILKLDVHLDQTDIPQWLKKTLFFWSWDIVPSATYKLDFTY